MEQKEGEREQDTRETERERECVQEGEWSQEEVASVVKMTVGEMDHSGLK